MELKETVIMDLTGTLSSEEIKTDFFDFVVPSDSNDNHCIQQFSKQMRNPFLESIEDSKESNNNTMLITELPDSLNDGFEPTLWNVKDTVKIETALLEDLNKYCWMATTNEVEQLSPEKSNNTDEQIYTLTVLNGIDQSATWYRLPKEDESMSSPSSMEQLQVGIDIDSILSVMPSNNYNSFNENNVTTNTDGLIKSETYTYDDNKDEITNALIVGSPMLESPDTYESNNNDWKVTNNNNDNSSEKETPDSLLRSALQGKSYIRYNGSFKPVQQKSPQNENNVELRKVLSTPPTKTDSVFLKDEQDKIPTIVAGIDANGKIIFEEHVVGKVVREAENSTNVDDLLLSQLDHPYPEDFEKLKRIENEVAESVHQYCQLDTSGENSITSVGGEQIGLLYINTPIQTTTPTVLSTKPTKKYKRQNSGGNNNKAQTTIQTATSTNVVRKERSLHYCNICSKGFKDKYSVNVHIRTHTGEKPFACSLCGKSFRQKAHLAKHYQTHIAQKNAVAAGNVATVKDAVNASFPLDPLKAHQDLPPLQ